MAALGADALVLHVEVRADVHAFDLRLEELLDRLIEGALGLPDADDVRSRTDVLLDGELGEEVRLP